VYLRERIEAQIPKAMQRGSVEFGTGGIAQWGRMSGALKKRIRFKQHNLMKPLSGEDPFDVIFCRNVLYYFDAEAMLNAVRILHSHVVPSGTLVLSHAETLQNLDVPWRYLMPSVYARDAGAKQVQVSPKPLALMPQRRTRTRILIVEDSGTMQKLVARMLAKDPDFEVVGVAATVVDALAKLDALKPDVVTLDMNLEGETGLDFLKRVRPKSRVPTVLVTALAREEAPMVLEALENGASEYVQKPTMQDIDKVALELCEKIRAVREARLGRERAKPTKATAPSHSTVRADVELIAVGASTGGTEAIREFLEALPSQIPPIVVVQHIPPVFSKAFAERLNTLFPFEVKEAASGDAVRPGRVLIAPGGKQMRLARGSGGFIVTLSDEAPVSGHCPSVDVLFESVAKLAGPQSAGVLLTGMGRDGAQGLLAMKAACSRTFAQDEESCVVFGMPRAAIELGAAECVASLQDLPRKVWSVLRSKRTA
jgi:two-component system chemotaxis response regulator CheB